MLKLLKNFAIQHFTEEKLEDITLEYTNGNKINYVTAQAPSGIKLPEGIFSSSELWLVKENDEYVLKELCSWPIQKKDQVSYLEKLNNVFEEKDYDNVLNKTADIWRNWFIDVDEKEYRFTNSTDILTAILLLKKRINLEIEWHESEIKRMRQGYSFLRQLDNYNI